MAIEVFAPAKINLALHVTGQREDGYHLLDSLVAFADVGDRLTVSKSKHMHLEVTGPFAAGVPTDQRNLCWRAAELFGEPVAITLEKNLPHAAGIGGGSSDAAAVLNAMEQLFDRPLTGSPLSLGADIPVCRLAQAARMQGIGETLDVVTIPPLSAVLINPGIHVPTPQVFQGLASKNNPAMDPLPPAKQTALLSWLDKQRNDLELSAIAAQPAIRNVLQELTHLGAQISLMSGSGATCFGLFPDQTPDQTALETLKSRFPDWWITPTTLS